MKILLIILPSFILDKQHNIRWLCYFNTLYRYTVLSCDNFGIGSDL